jgi:bacteriorhodopsin
VPGISVAQFDLIQNILSFTVSAMGAAAVFFFLQRREVSPKYRAVVTLAGIVTMIATYNYVRLLDSWNGAYIDVNGTIKATSHLYNEAFRYADWLLTVPILMVMLVMVIDLPKRQAQVRSFVLGLQAVEMILLGYPGQMSTDNATRWLWWAASMVPFLIIVYQLYVTLAQAVRSQPENARHLVVAARFMTVVVWCAYPVIYTLPMLGVTGTNSFVFTQGAYAIADVTAKAVYGVLIYMIAMRKSAPEEATVADGRQAGRLRAA